MLAEENIYIIPNSGSGICFYKTESKFLNNKYIIERFNYTIKKYLTKEFIANNNDNNNFDFKLLIIIIIRNIRF